MRFSLKVPHHAVSTFALVALLILPSRSNAQPSDTNLNAAIGGQGSGRLIHVSSEPQPRERITRYEDLVSLAKAVAERPSLPQPELPPFLAGLDYDGYRMIAFRPERALWWNADRPYWYEFFHRGFVHRDRVDVHVISDPENGKSDPRPVPFPFDRDLFEYRGPTAGISIPPDTGYAGLKVVGRFPNDDSGQEMLTFVGASYFRCRSGMTGYGTSARGLALNAASDGKEEFPVFREFWICEPAKDDATATILALMDSESVAGAYEFKLKPGEIDSTVHVRCTLYFRDAEAKIGIAPLSSMWMWGDGLVGPPLDARPSVHDADGLQVHDGDGWMWRALSRQRYPSLSRIPVKSLRGFGLMQRERRWSRYRDGEARYHQRPSVWIEPDEAWEGGAIEIFEMPAIHEGHDNIAGFWVPPEKPGKLEPVELSYTVHFFAGSYPPSLKELAIVRSTALKRHENGEQEFLVTFSRPSLRDSVTSLPELSVTSVRGEILHQSLTEDDRGTWNVRLTVRPTSESDPVELSATLQREGTRLSETWSYLAAPVPPPYKYPQVYTRRDE